MEPFSPGLPLAPHTQSLWVMCAFDLLKALPCCSLSLEKVFLPVCVVQWVLSLGLNVTSSEKPFLTSPSGSQYDNSALVRFLRIIY